MRYILIAWVFANGGGVDIHSIRFDDLESCKLAVEQFSQRDDRIKAFCTYDRINQNDQ